MSTLDRINSELAELQKGLSVLKHYTDEIGKSQEAADSVIGASQQFLEVFKGRVEAITKLMDTAVEDFRSQVTSTSNDFDTAGNLFKKGVDESLETLEQIGRSLEIAARNVNELARKIDEINILGHFSRLHELLREIQDDIRAIDKRQNDQMIQLRQTLEKKIQKSNLILFFGFGVVFLLLIAILFLNYSSRG